MSGDLIGADPFRVAAVPEFTPGTISDLVTTEYVYAQYTALVDRGEIVLLGTRERGGAADADECGG